MRSRLRYVFVIAGLVLIVVLLGGIKFWEISTLIAFGKNMEAAGPPPESTATTTVRTATWESTLEAVGSVSGQESVNVSTDSAGIVTKIHFTSGAMVKRGQILVELDADPERAQLKLAEAQRDLSELDAKRSQELFDKSAIARADLDKDLTTKKTASSQVAALQAQVEKKIVRAPFAGRIGLRAVNVGQYVQPGAAIASLEAVGGLYVDFAVPQQDLGRLRVGLPVRVEAGSETIQASLSAIDPAIDEATRNVRLRANVPAGETRLHAGMFVRVTVVLPEHKAVLFVPLTAVVHASYGDSVFVVEAKPANAPGMRVTPDGRTVKVVRQQFVRVGATRGDFVAVEQGLKSGQEVVSAGAFKLRNGAPIVVENRAQLTPQLAPRPENR